MAGDDLKKVQRGQALRMPASAYSAFIDAAADYRRRTLRIQGRYKQRDSRSGVVIVRNQSGSALDQFAVVELGSVIIGPADNEQPRVVQVRERRRDLAPARPEAPAGPPRQAPTELPVLDLRQPERPQPDRLL